MSDVADHHGAPDAPHSPMPGKIPVAVRVIDEAGIFGVMLPARLLRDRARFTEAMIIASEKIMELPAKVPHEGNMYVDVDVTPPTDVRTYQRALKVGDQTWTMGHNVPERVTIAETCGVHRRGFTLENGTGCFEYQCFRTDRECALDKIARDGTKILAAVSESMQTLNGFVRVMALAAGVVA
jgi:hypothetical protein